jgi:citrate lyase subunit beta/citryl-CoA lyase
MTTTLCRSYLYVPGHQPDRIAKAYKSVADAVVLDLEDAVPGSEKDNARAIIAELLSEPPVKPTYVRVNSPASGRCLDDLRAVAPRYVSGIRLPKVEHPDEVARAAAELDTLGSTAELQLIIESARGLNIAYQLATASPRVGLVGLGESDLRADLRVALDESALDSSRAQCVLASRAARLPSPIQSVYPEVRDLDGLFTSTLRGKSMGFFGRFAVHPSQLKIIHDVYTPTREEITKAQAVTHAARRAESQNLTIVITEEGSFVGPPIVAHAKQLLDVAEGLKIGVRK